MITVRYKTCYYSINKADFKSRTKNQRTAATGRGRAATTSPSSTIRKRQLKRNQDAAVAEEEAITTIRPTIFRPETICLIRQDKTCSNLENPIN